MGRYGLLLVVVGLIIGLFLGFNPATHRALVRWWDRTATASPTTRAERPAPAPFSLRQLDSSVARLFRTTPRAEVHTPRTEPSTLPIVSQIEAALHQIWLALQRLWLSIEAKFAATKSS